MIAGQSPLYKIARVKTLFMRGQGWLYIGKDMIMLFIGIYVVEDLLRRWGFPVQPWFVYFYPLLPLGYVISCILVGWADEQKGIWKEEARYGISKDINPVGREMYDKLVELHTEIVEMRRNGKT